MKITSAYQRIVLAVIVLLIVMTMAIQGQGQDNSKILWTANWSNDGKYIAIGGVDSKIRIFDGLSFQLLKVFDNRTGVLRMGWHPTAHLLAIAGEGGGSAILEVDKDSVIQLKGNKDHGSRSIAWNHSGEFLANADYEGEITIWTKNGELVRTINKENTISNVAIDWHPNRNEFIVLSDLVRVYDVNGNLLNKFSHRKEQVLMLCVKWHKTGKYFVLGDYGDHDKDYKPLLQFRNADGTLAREIYKSRAEYRNMSWTKDGKRLATASDALRIWNTEGELIAEGLSDDKLWGVDWRPDGKYIITSSHNGHIRLWDDKGQFIRELVY